MKLIAFLVTLFSFDALAQSDTLKSYTTTRVAGMVPAIDGLGNDEAWNQVEWAGGDFRQVMPDKGKPASVQTKFKILYDAKNLYVLFRCFDPEPDKIMRRMSRRDGFEGDWVEINIDSYFDKRTAFSFTSSVSGVKGDEYVSNNGENWDTGWDPIWYMKTSIDSEGWMAELRIPLSQLRFTDKPELVWGFNVQRLYFKNQERSQWTYIPPDGPGYVHLMGELRGITGVRPQKQVEIQPYILGSTETYQKEEGNPFVTGSDVKSAVGLDAKIGITSDITLDLTVNPDFGQVEADPSQVNLTAFELFFEERRPFFIEGNNTLNFPINQQTSNNLFYSRRIGRPPQGFVDPDGSGVDDVNEYVKPLQKTSILGAAKLTGKNSKGFSWGIMESVTAKEFAEIDSLGHRRKEIVEPMTNYLVARAQQDINKGNTLVGGMITATHRQLDEPALEWLHKDAYSAGLDFTHHWNERKYYVSSKVMMSYVQGTPEAISNTQLSSERFFQRPDNEHTEYDPLRTSLSGTAGEVIIGKKSGNFLGDIGFMWQSPGLELNDMGFLSNTDLMRQTMSMQYRIMETKGATRNRFFYFNQWLEMDFGGRKLDEGFHISAEANWTNFWQSGGGVLFRTSTSSNGDLRGGPRMQYPGRVYMWCYTATDRRKKFQVYVNPEFGIGNHSYNRSASLSLDFVWRPVNAFNVAVSPSMSFDKNQMQYVTTATGDETRYVVGEIDQTTARIVIRATYMVTPNLSLQYYGQPFGTAGRYSNFKQITVADAPNYTDRFQMLPALLGSNDTYGVDHNGDGVDDFSFGRPDFNFGQFRSNAVLRWEYIPGSTFFIVWTRERNGAFYDIADSEHNRYSFDFTQKAHNIFLAKFTYRFRL
jgi:hypothetical protein